MTQQPHPHGPGPASGRPGQMTAVMRAVMATGPKVLRIGLVQSGRVLEERIIKQRTHVTVGPSEKSMFVVSASVPANFRLFELVGNDYCLNFLDGMSGRIALPTGISDLSVLRGHARRTQQGAYQIRLTEDSRGKVVVGDTTFLFQFVAPPPVQPKPQLPVSVTRGATAIDWGTTMIAAFSFLMHFAAIGTVYSDWLDPVVDDEVSVAGLIDSVKRLPPPPPVEEQTNDKAENADKTAETKTATPTKTQTSKDTAPKQMSDQAKAALANELAQLEMQTLGTLANVGPATAGVLTGGEVPTSALDAAAASGAGVGASGGLSIGGAGGAIRPGMAGGGLGSLGTTAGGGGSDTGKTAKVKGPSGSASVGGASVSGGTVSNASRVVAGMRAGFRACYQRGLSANPDIQGSVRLSIRVGPGGEVQSVSASPSGNLGGDVVGCVRSRAQAAQFDPPEGGSAVVVVPVTFVKQ